MTPSRRKPEARPPDLLELIATWISGALFAAVVAFLIWDALRTSLPPSFETSIEARVQRGSHTYVTVAVRNLGDDAARTVEVRVVAEGSEKGTEARFTLDWLPGRSTRRGVAVFPQTVAVERLRTEVAGYAEP